MWAEALPDSIELLRASVLDGHPRVRLESVVAASYVPSERAIEVVAAAVEQPRDPFLDYAIRLSALALRPRWGDAFGSGKLALGSPEQQAYLAKLLVEKADTRSPGEAVYEVACLTCHQPEGKGLPGVYPPLAGSERLRAENPSALIKIVLHGLSGPISVAGEQYGDQLNSVPMPPMGGLTDRQIADVLTFVREAYGSG